MPTGQFVFSQVMDHLPMKAFRRCVQRYHGNRYVKSFTCLDQFLCLAFAQLTHRESLRDIEVCLRAHPDKLYHLGLRGRVARNTLAHANQTRNWRLCPGRDHQKTARSAYRAPDFDGLVLTLSENLL